MTLKEFKTIKSGELFEARYEIQKSRFIASVQHVETEEGARQFLQQIKKKYFDARHNSSAWVIGINGDKQKSNDDGEPGGTAGNPILETIKKNNLTNVVVVVTRYFGGIKLGAGGLIRAYSHTAALGLAATEILTMTPMLQVEIVINYNLLASVENWIRQKEISVTDKSYAENVKLSLLILPSKIDETLTELKDLTAANLNYEIGAEILIPVAS